MYGVEVKQNRILYKLPKVFLTPNLNKFATTGNYVDCRYYESRSGLTREGCVIFNGDVHRVHGIYYTPIPSILDISYRRKTIRDEEDVKKILEKVNLSVTTELLVRWHNYAVYVFDRFIKGGMYEFPVLFDQGHLSVYNIPEVSEGYRIVYENDNEKREINTDSFEEVTEFNIYNHTVKFDKKVLKLKDLYVSPGMGAIIYTNEDVTVVSESPDHEKVEKFIYQNSWVLFSHPRPQKNKAD